MYMYTFTKCSFNIHTVKFQALLLRLIAVCSSLIKLTYLISYISGACVVWTHDSSNSTQLINHFEVYIICPACQNQIQTVQVNHSIHVRIWMFLSNTHV